MKNILKSLVAGASIFAMSQTVSAQSLFNDMALSDFGVENPL